MTTNTEIKPWEVRRSEYYEQGGSIRIRSDGYFKSEEIDLLRAALEAKQQALEAANTRIEDLTTAANRCINDALGMADPVLEQLVEELKHARVWMSQRIGDPRDYGAALIADIDTALAAAGVVL